MDVGIDNLRILTAGSIPPNPHELLASPAMRALERDIRQRVDLVIYDTPAVLAVPDALELGRHVDLAILVGRAGVTGRRQLQSAIERLTQVGTDVAGTVLNDISGRADGYYYAYYYADEAGKETAAGTSKTGLFGRKKKGAVGAGPAPAGTSGDAGMTRGDARSSRKAERAKLAAAPSKRDRKAAAKASARAAKHGGAGQGDQRGHLEAETPERSSAVRRLDDYSDVVPASSYASGISTGDGTPSGAGSDGSAPPVADGEPAADDVAGAEDADDRGTRDAWSDDGAPADGDPDSTDRLPKVSATAAPTADDHGDLLFGDSRR